MKQKNKISIIVPVYNAEKTVERCINSILSQTIKNFELILVDDGSKDASLQILRQYEKLDPRVLVISKENGGAGSARNAGIDAAVGDYLAFPDADDWVEPDAYEKLLDKAIKFNADLVVCGAFFHNENKNGAELSQEKIMTPDGFYCKGYSDCQANVMKLLPDSYLFGVPWNKLYKRQVIISNDLKYTNLRRTQDAVFNLDFYDRIQSLCVISNPLYHYVIPYREEIKYPKDYAYIRMSYYLHLVEKLKKWGVFDSSVKKYYDTRFFRHFWNAMCLCFQKSWHFSRKERSAYISEIMNNKDFCVFFENADIEQSYKEKLKILNDKDVRAFFSQYRKDIMSERMYNLRYLPNKFLILCLGEEKYGKIKKLMK